MNLKTVHVVIFLMTLLETQSLEASEYCFSRKEQEGKGCSEATNYTAQVFQWCIDILSEAQRSNKAIKSSNDYVKYYGKTSQTFNEHIKKE